MASFTNEEYADTLLRSGSAYCNGRAEQILYWQRFSDIVTHAPEVWKKVSPFTVNGNLNLREYRVNVRQENVALGRQFHQKQ